MSEKLCEKSSLLSLQCVYVVGHEERISSCPGSWESFAMSRVMRAGHESTYIPRIAHSTIRIASSADYIENPFFTFLSSFFSTLTHSIPFSIHITAPHQVFKNSHLSVCITYLHKKIYGFFKLSSFLYISDAKAFESAQVRAINQFFFHFVNCK